MFKTLMFFSALCGATYLAGVTGYLPNYVYSDGQRSGTVVKLSHKGYVCKSWEGQMNMGAFSGNNTTVGTTMFEFSVLDQKVVEAINAKAATGERATLTYQQMLFPAPCQRETDYVIVKVE